MPQLPPRMPARAHNIEYIAAKGNSFCRLLSLSLSPSFSLSLNADCRISWNKAILLKARSKGSLTLLILMKFLRLDNIGRFTFTLHKCSQPRFYFLAARNIFTKGRLTSCCDLTTLNLLNRNLVSNFFRNYYYLILIFVSRII